MIAASSVTSAASNQKVAKSLPKRLRVTVLSRDRKEGKDVVEGKEVRIRSNDDRENHSGCLGRPSSRYCCELHLTHGYRVGASLIQALPNEEVVLAAMRGSIHASELSRVRGAAIDQAVVVGRSARLVIRAIMVEWRDTVCLEVLSPPLLSQAAHDCGPINAFERNRQQERFPLSVLLLQPLH